jgi:hypothetical protein
MSEQTQTDPASLDEAAVQETKTAPETGDSGQTGFFNQPKVLQLGLYLIGFIAVVLIVWGVGSWIVNGAAGGPLPTPSATVAPSQPSDFATPVFSTEEAASGVVRFPKLQITQVPEVADRYEVETYIVEQGDTIFGIAEKFGLKPETVLWSNRYTLGDTPDGLRVGIELFILPVDGVYHQWSAGEGLNGVASFYGVEPETIINYPGNSLDPAQVGDFSNPNIEPGTMLVVPEGQRPTVAWVVPRDNPASGSSYLGPGACSGIIYGDVGTGTFTWPTTATWLSGYDYNPPVHNGLDFDGDFGSPIYAADSGVIVYSGWSDRGYGNLIVVDHDRGWQTFYAHLMDNTLLPCGSNVQKGDLIASMASTGNSTGPHLHFEMRLEGQPVNPWQFLQ